MASWPLQSASANQPQSLGKELTISDLSTLTETLHSVAHKCAAFGDKVGVKYSTICSIQRDYRHCGDQLREILAHRLNQLPRLTWHDIVQALQSSAVQMDHLASEIGSQHVYQSSVSTFPPVTCLRTHTAPTPSTHHSASQSSVQSNLPTHTPHAQWNQPTPSTCVPVDHIYSHPQQPFCPQQSLLQYSLPHLLTNTGMSTPSHQQTDTLQSSSLPTPFSSQFMSMLNTFQAMRGTQLLPPDLLFRFVNQFLCNSQLSQDVATPHHLQVGEQQALQGQPPLQHIPSHEPQTVAQSHSTSSTGDPPPAKRKQYESSMAQYIAYIRTIYKSSEVERDPKATKWPPTPSKVFINLVCIDRKTVVTKQEADEITLCMVFEGSVDVILGKKTLIEFSDITKDLSHIAQTRVILVEGAPGVGKSTFSWEFCRSWERGEIAYQYQLVLLLRLRDERVSRAQSLADLIYHPSHHIRQAVVHELEFTLGFNTLIILEGFDELPSTCRAQCSVFLQLIHGHLLPLATVLVTSRPWATQDIHRECNHRIFRHIEILGFSSKQIEEYVFSVFADRGMPANDQNVEKVMSYINTYPQIKACMYIPLNSAIVVSVYQESKAGKCILPKTLTELYYALTQTLLLRYLYGHPEYGQKNWKIQSLKEDLPQNVYSQLLAIGELAYSGICNDQGDSVQLIFSNLPPDFETLGLMQSVPQLYVTRGVVVSHNFLHLTVQEFLATLHISNMSPEKQLEHFQRQEEGRLRVVLRFLAGLTKLAHLSPDLLRSLLLKKLKEDEGEEEELANPSLSLQRDPNVSQINKCSIAADVELSIQPVHWMFEAQRHDIVPLVLQEKIIEFCIYEGLAPLDYYSLGYCIGHSHSQWVLTVKGIREDVLEEEEVRMLVAGANTRPDTATRVVGLRGCERDEEGGYGGYRPLSISAEALNLMSTGLQDVLHLQELHLEMPVECCSITWPDLSGLRVLHLAISGKRNWRLDSLLPHLLLESLTIEAANDGDTVVREDCVAIGMLLSFSDCLKCLHFQLDPCGVMCTDDQGMESITKAMSENVLLPLKSLEVECECAFSNPAAHSLALFITNSTTLHNLSIVRCTFSAHGLLELARATQHSSSLQERKLERLTCTIDGDDEASAFAQLLIDYPHMEDWLDWDNDNCPLQCSHISDKGAQSIVTALHHNSALKLNLSNNNISDTGSAALAQTLHHNSTLRELDLCNNNISDTGSTTLAQALHHNSTLRRLFLSGNDAISAEGTHQLLQAMTVNTSIIIVLPRRCEEYAMQCPQYSTVKNRIVFK